MMSEAPPARGVRAVALLEAAKGALVVVAGVGILPLAHRDAQRIADALVAHLHLDPAKRFPQVLLEAATRLQDTRLWVLAALAVSYAALRFAEAYGLWRGRRWAEWLAALSGGIYVPFELDNLAHRVSGLSLAALAVNLLVVGYMIYVLARSRPP
jgi:uncharacterized membrane protein (DUF2068 family)